MMMSQSVKLACRGGDAVAHEVGHDVAGEHGQVGHGQGAEAVDNAFLQVVGDGDGCGARTKGQGLDDDAGQQEGEVVDAGRQGFFDSAAKHHGE
jgi:hypothetical protein